MKTQVNLDEALVDEAFRLTGAETEDELLREALEELIRARRKRSLEDLAGKIQFHDGFDHKALRGMGPKS